MQEMEQNLQASLDQAAIDFSDAATAENGEALTVSVAHGDELDDTDVVVAGESEAGVEESHGEADEPATGDDEVAEANHAEAAMEEQSAQAQHAEDQHTEEQHGDATVAPTEDIQPEAEDDRSQSH